MKQELRDLNPTYKKLLAIGSIVLVIDEIRDIYESLQTAEVQAVCNVIMPLFAYFQYEVDREKVYDLLKGDQLFNSMPKSNKFQIERSGREQFSLCCGYLYTLLSEKETKEGIIQDILKEEGLTKRAKIQRENIESLKKEKAGKLKAGASASGLLSINRKIKDAESDFKKLHQEVLRQKSGVHKRINEIIAACKPFYMKGAMLNTFISKVNMLYSIVEKV